MQTNFDQLLEETKNKALSLYDLKPENQWNLETNNENLKLYTRLNQDIGLTMNRTEINAQLDPEQFLNFISDINKRKDYDSNFAESRIIEKIDANTQIFYVKNKSMAMLVDPRDFCVLNRIYKQENGTFISVSVSIEHPQAPPVKGAQRGQILFSCWILKKQQNGLTNIVQITSVDPKGDLPKALVNKGSKTQSEQVQKTVQYWIKNQK